MQLKFKVIGGNNVALVVRATSAEGFLVVPFT